MRWFLVGVVVAVAIILYAFFHALMAPARQVRSLPTGVWIVAILVLPVVGAGLWFWLGAPSSRPGAAAPAPRGLGPDDDPEFLRRLEQQRRQKERQAAQDEREAQLRAKEAELRAREERLRRERGQEKNPGESQNGG